MLDRIIFGDNQFFGINHMSEEKAQALSEKFRDLKAIMEVIDIAYDCGIRAFMFNTHDMTKEICDYFRKNSDRYADLRLYPSMPYAHKYANAVAEKGIFGALKRTIVDDSTAGDIVGIVADLGPQIRFILSGRILSKFGGRISKGGFDIPGRQPSGIHLHRQSFQHIRMALQEVHQLGPIWFWTVPNLRHLHPDHSLGRPHPT